MSDAFRGGCENWRIIFRKHRTYTSFITKSRTPGSPMKLGVNPSSVSLFSSSPSLPDPSLNLTCSHLCSAKDVKEKFGVIGVEQNLRTFSNVKVTQWIIKDQRLQSGAGGHLV